MDKAKKIGLAFVFMLVAYFFITALMPMFTAATTGAAGNISASLYAADYVGAAAAASYTPLAYYFLPGVLFLVFTVITIKRG